jgi:homoserine kinase
VHALQNGEYDRLHEALQDRWHQPARAALVPHLSAVLALNDPEVLGAYLSGAGPSVAVLARRDFDRIERLLAATCEAAGTPVTVRTLAAHQPLGRSGQEGRNGQEGIPSRLSASPWRSS